MKYAHAIFCDDIRHERGGQTSYIGVYQSHLYIYGQLPRTTRLHAVVWIVSTDGEPFESITLVIEHPNGHVTTQPYPQLPKPDANAGDASRQRLVAQADLTFDPFHIADESALGRLAIHADIDGQRVPASAIEMLHADQGDTYGTSNA